MICTVVMVEVEHRQRRPACGVYCPRPTECAEVGCGVPHDCGQADVDSWFDYLRAFIEEHAESADREGMLVHTLAALRDTTPTDPPEGPAT